jgi:hypothetical protein
MKLVIRITQAKAPLGKRGFLMGKRRGDDLGFIQ